MDSTGRQYDLVVLGATGFTGKYITEYVHEHAAPDFRWAIAGRSVKKLEDLATELKAIVPARSTPAVEVCQLNVAELDTLAKKTKVLITAVGPYCKYGTPVVEACAKNGTHYLDVTGEAPWVYEMIEKYHDVAKDNKSVIICQCGIDSVPADILAYVLTHHVREKFKTGTATCVVSVQDMKGGMSGGTAATILSIGTAYPIPHLKKAMAPFGLSPVEPAPAQKRPAVTKSLWATLCGYIDVPDLGILRDAPQGPLDAAIVGRSWGLFDSGKYYGPNFRFSEMIRAPSALNATAQAYAGMYAGMLLLFGPGRWLLSKFMPVPGEGPGREAAKSHYTHYKAVATSDDGRRVAATMEAQGSQYYCTALFVVEAAMEILKGGGGRGLEMGGLVTPATLEGGYVDRLAKAGVQVDVTEL